jgi:glutathione peroxidase
MNVKKVILNSIYSFLKLYNKKSDKLIIKKPPGAGGSKADFYSLKATTIKGDTLDFSAFRGKKVILVNTASACGYTAQYSQLEKLHQQFKSVLVVVGLPSNDFGKQEPGRNEEISKFCKEVFHVTFPMTEKIHVAEGEKHPVYRWLCTKELNGWNNVPPVWNFCKYLIDENGQLQCFFSQKVNPLDPALLEQIT